MLADVLFGIWIVMSGALGWKRLGRHEIPSLLVLSITLLLSRLVAFVLMNPLAKVISRGPLEVFWVLSLTLWLLFFFLGWRFWLSWSNQRGGSVHTRIDMDEFGQPIVRGRGLQVVLGIVFGLVRGAVLYLGIVSCLAALVPNYMYRDGRGTAMIHAKSKSMQWMQMADPMLRRMGDVVQGLRSVRYIQRSTKAMRKVQRNASLKTLWNSRAIRTIRKDKRLLSRANQKRLGRRNPTLLLWIPSFHWAVTDAARAHALITLGKVLPAPFDKSNPRSQPTPRRK